MRRNDYIPDVAALCGLALLAGGLSLIYVPAAMVGCGALMLAYGILAGRTR